MKDDIYSDQLEWVENFTFDEKVANVFQDMISRSVPGYRTTLAMIGVIVSKFVKDKTFVYDLGCSDGAGTIVAANANPNIAYEVIGIDNSQAMLEQCLSKIKELPPTIPVKLRNDDIRETSINKASVVILNFTLQFLPIEDRLNLLKRIYDNLVSGGVLILSEKIHFETPEKETLLYELHHDFKRKNGYSDLEISQKRTALENTLITETSQTHQARLNQAGFEHIFPWFQCFNFTSLIAVKP